MTNVWCVRANSGEFTQHFLRGGYAGIGWSEITHDLGQIASREDLYRVVRAAAAWYVLSTTYFSRSSARPVLSRAIAKRARLAMEPHIQTCVLG